MRVTPRPWIGITVFLLYLAAFYGTWIATGIDYLRVGESITTILTWYVLPLAAGAVVLIVAASVLGWWRPSLFETRRAPAWLWIAPVVMLAITVVFLAVNKDYSAVTPVRFAAVALGSVLVGFCEEMASRGILITALRGRFTEPWVWFLSCLLFGLLHLPNWVFGAGPQAMLQVVIAFAGGSVFYLARRASGTLLVPMVMHGLWDFTSFISPTDPSLSPLVFANAIVGLAVSITFLVKARGTHVPNLGTAANRHASVADPLPET